MQKEKSVSLQDRYKTPLSVSHGSGATRHGVSRVARCAESRVASDDVGSIYVRALPPYMAADPAEEADPAEYMSERCRLWRRRPIRRSHMTVDDAEGAQGTPSPPLPAHV